MMTALKKAGLPALVLLGVLLAMAGCAQGTEQDQGQGQQSQPEASVLTVSGAGDGVSYEAEVYKYTKAVADAAALTGIISVFEIVGTGTGTADNETLEISLKTPKGADFTSNGKFLVVLTSTDDNANASLKYMAAVTFSGGSATLKYEEMESGTVEPNSYTVTFHTNGGTPADFTQTVADGGKVTLPSPAPTRTGYALDGWFLEAAGTGAAWDFDNDTVTTNLDLYAKWTRTYTVTFNLNYGSNAVHATQTVTHNGNATLPDPAPTRTDGYFFEGWFTQASGGTEYIFSSPVTADIALYAKWTDEIKTAAIADEYLASKSANTADSPILLKMNLAIADNWNALVTTLASRTKYAALDLSACSMSGTAFDIYSGDVIGKNYIVSLILPDAATSIANSSSGNSTYSDNDSRYYNDSYSALRTVNGANITTIGEYVFQDCTAMTAASFPKATAIENSAFLRCSALTSVDFPKAVTIESNAFNSTALTAVSFPEATTVKGSFMACKSLISVSFPKATNFYHTFQNCTSLTSVSLPEATNIGSNTFSMCTALTSVSFPKVTNIGLNAFWKCGTTPLTITMGNAAPTVGTSMFVDSNVTSTKNVTVRVPSGATGYDETWKTAFKGRSAPNVNLVIQYY